MNLLLAIVPPNYKTYEYQNTRSLSHACSASLVTLRP